MPSGYPAAIDNFNDPTAVDNLNTPAVLHHTQHTNVNDAINAIETELGLNPKGAALSVKARLDAIDLELGSKLDGDQYHVPFGVATLDGGSMLVENVDASKVTSGVLNVGRIPNISGAKILGTGSGGATIPIDALPDHSAAKVTSGTFNIARIPVIPLATGVSGTLPAAMIPSSVTSNANSRVVNDAAGRNAIPLGDRVDGMLVTQKTPFSLWVWRADNSTWNQIGGAPGAPIEVLDSTDYLGLVNTGFSPGTSFGTSFVAPASGSVFATVSFHGEGNVSSAIAYLSYEIKTGAVVGSGTPVNTPTTEEGVGIGGFGTGAGARIRASARNLHTGLTPGASYNIRTIHLVTSGSMDIFSRKLLVEMVAQ